MFQPAPNSSYTKPNIYIKSERLHPVEKFTYLSFTLSRNVHIDDDVNLRIAKASSAFWPPKQNSMGPSWHYQSNKA